MRALQPEGSDSGYEPRSVIDISEISNIEDGEISDYDCDISYE